MGRKRSWTDEKLIEGCNHNKVRNFNELMLFLGLIPHGDNTYKIKKRIKELNLNPKFIPNCKYDEKQIEKLFPKSKSLNDLAKKLGLKQATPALQKYLSEKNLVPRKEEIDYFGDNTLEEAYWAGFIAADGSINKNTLYVGQSIKDKNHLQKLAKIFNAPLKEKPSYTTYLKEKDYYITSSGQFEFYVISSIVTNNLRKIYSITERKTYTLKPPKISDLELIKAFIIGYIDGDGCIQITKNNYLYFAISGASYPMLLWLKHYLGVIGNIDETNLKFTKVGNSHVFSFNCSKAEKILNELNSVNVPKLERKWSKVTYYAKKKKLDRRETDRRM